MSIGSDLPIDHPLLEGLPSCDPSLVLAFLPIREDSGAECTAGVLSKLKAEGVEGVSVKALSPVVLEVTFRSVWASGSLIVVAGRRAVRVFRQDWTASTPDALLDDVRTAWTRGGCGIGVVVSIVILVLLLSAASEDGAPEGRVRIVTLIIPFLIPPLLGAGIGTAIGVKVGHARAQRARTSGRTLEQDVAARDSFAAHVVAVLKEFERRDPISA